MDLEFIGTELCESRLYRTTRNFSKFNGRDVADLLYLNTIAGRTYNDLTQYPVFPWVLQDYTSSQINLGDKKSFRDLSKPIGAQDAVREAKVQDRYSEFEDHEGTPKVEFYHACLSFHVSFI